MKMALAILFTFVGFVQMVAVAAQPSADRLEEFLTWLPFDSETLTVTRGPFVAPDLSSPTAPNDLQGMLRADSIGFPIAGIDHQVLYNRLSGKTVLIAVAGTRRFRVPDGLGAMPYDGCHILTIDADLPAFIDSITNLAGKSLSHEVAGSKVLVFKERWENDDWQIHVAAPEVNVLVVCTDQRSMSDLLERRKQHSGRRAFPTDLPEWKYVDQAAPFWAIRHYSSQTAKDDPSSPLKPFEGGVSQRDPRAIGYVFQYRPTTSPDVELVYLSTNKDSAAIARSFWTQPNLDLNPSVKPLGNSGVSVTLPVGNQAQSSTLLWLINAVFGRGVFI